MQAVKNRQKKTMVQEAKNTIKIYTERGSKVVETHKDQEFKWTVYDM